MALIGSIDIDSSWLIEADYDEEEQELTLVMNHATYVYHDVPLSVVQLFFSSESKGRAYNWLIRDAYGFTQVR